MPQSSPRTNLLSMIKIAQQRVRFHRIARGFGPAMERASRHAIDNAKRDMRAAWHVFNLTRSAPENQT